MELTFKYDSAASYEQFLKVRQCPVYRFRGGVATVPDQYASMLGVRRQSINLDYAPSSFLFDYQRDITKIAIAKRKYAIFADCGLGKTFMLLEFAKHAAISTGGKILIVSPLMVCKQTLQEANKWYPELSIGYVPSSNLNTWLNESIQGECQIALTNYEAIREGLIQGQLKGLVLDESSYLKSHYGAWGTRLIELGAGLEWKLCATGTPAPNDRIEFANHAVFLDRAKTVNEFLACYFINRGETQNRWELKPHALKPFYRSLADWSIFLTNPATYGWKDNVGTMPPMHVHIEHVDLTEEQRSLAQQLTGNLITTNVGGIGDRGKLSQIAKGKNGVATNKPAFIRRLVDSWPDESTIIWCNYNEEQESMERTFPDAVSISGDTPEHKRYEYVDAFKSGSIKVLISKPKILGFGLNLQVCTRQVFSGLKDCYDETTEVLTEDGWKSFSKIQIGDVLATVNPDTCVLEYQAASRVVWSPYEGPMVRFASERNFDLLVTPNHRMFVKRCDVRYRTNAGKWHFRYANEIAENFKRQELRMQSCPIGGWEGNSCDYIENDYMVTQRSTAKVIQAICSKDAIKLAGWYLSEGHCRPQGSVEFGRIVICQTDMNPENRKEIIKLLSRIAGSVNDRTKDITCYSRNLAAWLIGEFGHGSHFKRIPSWLKNMDTKSLSLLRDTMLKGDGISDGMAYRTASKQLADDFQEVCLKTGCRASVKPRIGVCDRYPDTVVYDVNIARQNITPSVHVRPEVVWYSGMIGCATVPNGTLIVRRNGIPVVSGNSYEEYYQAVKRSNRIGSTKPLHIHIPVTELEMPFVDNVLRKAARVESDTREQEELFKEIGCANFQQ